jgi:hypothetical protein
VSNAPSKPVSFSRPKVGYFSNRPRIHTNNIENVTKQTIHRTTQKYREQHKKYIEQQKKYTEQHKNLEECRPCPVFAGFALAFALQLRKTHGETSVSG